MKKNKAGKRIFDQYRSLRDEIVSGRIREALKCGAAVAGCELGKSGFQWVDDGTDEDDVKQEDGAVPENVNQEFLVGYFEGHIRLSCAVIDAYHAEKAADNPNFSLLRRYFRQGNPALKALLLQGLDQSPTDFSLLHDLAFFHEHHRMLSELTSRYMTACRLENDPEMFTELAMAFYYNTIEDGFEALHELKKVLGDMSQKRSAIAQLLFEHEMMADLPDDILLM